MGKPRIGFHELLQTRAATQEEAAEHGWHVRSPATLVLDVLKFVCQKPEAERIKNISTRKYCKLVECEKIDDHIYFLYFKSALSGTKLPLMDRVSGRERDNPKEFTEGETTRTHMAIVLQEDRVMLINQKAYSGVSVKNFIDYCWSFLPQYAESLGLDLGGTNFDFLTVPTEDFMERLDNLERLIKLQLYVDKRILGSDALNHLNHTEQIQETVMIEVKAIRNHDIKETARDAFRKYVQGVDTYRHIRAIGKSANGNEFVLDTSFMEKVTYLDADVNGETGDFSTPSFRTKLIEAARLMLTNEP